MEIFIVNDVSKYYWENEVAIEFGVVDPYESESLFFHELKILTYFQYAEIQDGTKTYDEYYLERVSELTRELPYLMRLVDYYKDAFFILEELPLLRDEIFSIRESITARAAQSFLNQLLDATERALKDGHGLQFLAD